MLQEATDLVKKPSFKKVKLTLVETAKDYVEWIYSAETAKKLNTKSFDSKN